MAATLTREVAIKTLQGRVLKGHIDDFKPANGNVKLVQKDDEIVVLPLSGLKAIFFLRPAGRPAVPESVLRPGAVKVRVDFADGERLMGYSYGLRAGQAGFFVYPVGKTDRNERIYVIRANALKIATGV